MSTFLNFYLWCLSCFPSLVLGGTDCLNDTGLDRGFQEPSHLQRIKVLGCIISADNVLKIISCHLCNIHHIWVIINGLCK